MVVLVLDVDFFVLDVEDFLVDIEDFLVDVEVDNSLELAIVFLELASFSAGLVDVWSVLETLAQLTRVACHYQQGRAAKLECS